MLMLLWELIMADETPPGDKTVFLLCELIALAFATQAVQRMLDGRPLLEIVIAWMICVSFLYLEFNGQK